MVFIENSTMVFIEKKFNYGLHRKLLFYGSKTVNDLLLVGGLIDHTNVSMVFSTTRVTIRSVRRPTVPFYVFTCFGDRGTLSVTETPLFLFW